MNIFCIIIIKSSYKKTTDAVASLNQIISGMVNKSQIVYYQGENIIVKQN